MEKTRVPLDSERFLRAGPGVWSRQFGTAAAGGGVAEVSAKAGVRVQRRRASGAKEERIRRFLVGGAQGLGCAGLFGYMEAS